MNIEFVFTLGALFIAMAALVIAFGMASRINRLEREMDALRYKGTLGYHPPTTPYVNPEDIPAFLRRQAD